VYKLKRIASLKSFIITIAMSFGTFVCSALGWHFDFTNFTQDSILVFDHTSYWDAWLLCLFKLHPESRHVLLPLQPKLYDWLQKYLPCAIFWSNFIKAGSIHIPHNNTLPSFITAFQLQQLYRWRDSNNKTSHVAIALSPKGTVQKQAWKSGYVVLAQHLQCPIQAVVVHWTLKTVTFLPHRVSADLHPNNIEAHLKTDLSFGMPLVPTRSDALQLDMTTYDWYDCFGIDWVLLSNLSCAPLLLKLSQNASTASLIVQALLFVNFVVSWKYHASRETQWKVLDARLSKVSLLAILTYIVHFQQFSKINEQAFAVENQDAVIITPINQALVDQVYYCAMLWTIVLLCYLLGILANNTTRKGSIRIRGIYCLFHTLFHIFLGFTLHYYC